MVLFKTKLKCKTLLVTSMAMIVTDEKVIQLAAKNKKVAAKAYEPLILFRKTYMTVYFNGVILR